jgi:hypothetical protein
LVVINAMTGIAAVQLNGMTLHSAIKFNGKSTGADSVVPNDVKTAWMAARILIIDEVSMLDAKMLSMVNDKLQRIMENDLPFGGLHMLFSGDFFQLPPAHGVRLYGLTSAQESAGAAGRRLWATSLNAAVVLTTNIRQSGDAEYAAICQRKQVNQPLAADIVKVNSRRMSSTLRPPPGTVTVVETNALRQAINHKVFVGAVKQTPTHSADGTVRTWRERKLLRIRAAGTPVRRRKRKSKSSYNEEPSGPPLPPETIVKYMATRDDHNLCDDCFLSPTLEVILDDRYMATTNVCVAKGIANGTPGKVVDVLLTTDSVLRIDADGMHSMDSAHVRAIVLQHELDDLRNRNDFPSLGRGYFPFKPVTKTSKAVFWNGVRYRVNISQFPILHARCVTVYKVQGLTLRGIAIVPKEKRVPVRKGSKKKHMVGYMRTPGAMYVGFSRVTTSDGLFMASAVDGRLEEYTPRRDILLLVQRMFRLEHTMINDVALVGLQADTLRAFVAESEEHAQRVDALLATDTGKQSKKRKSAPKPEPTGHAAKRHKHAAAPSKADVAPSSRIALPQQKKRKRTSDDADAAAPEKRPRPNVASGSSRQVPITDDDLAPSSQGMDGYEADTAKYYDATFRNERRWLDDRIVNHACAILRSRACVYGPVYGLQDTLLLSHNAVNMRVQTNQGPQILHICNNHWMVVLGGTSSQRVYVYDTVPSGGIAADVKVLCARLYDRSDLVFEVMPIQRQVGGNDCGLFAIAIVEAILRSVDITTVTFDQFCMRTHLGDCFATNALSPFPLRPDDADNTR